MNGLTFPYFHLLQLYTVMYCLSLQDEILELFALTIYSVQSSGFVQISGFKIQDFFQTFFQNNNHFFFQTQGYHKGDQ